MTPHYTEMLRALTRTTRFEKHASLGGDAARDHAVSCSEAYELFTQKAASYGGEPTASGAALRAAQFAADLYETSASVGVKVASENDALAAIEQLSAVAYLDASLKVAAEHLSESDLAATQQLQLLGREYGVELLRGLVG